MRGPPRWGPPVTPTCHASLAGLFEPSLLRIRTRTSRPPKGLPAEAPVAVCAGPCQGPTRYVLRSPPHVAETLSMRRLLPLCLAILLPDAAALAQQRDTARVDSTRTMR